MTRKTARELRLLHEAKEELAKPLRYGSIAATVAAVKIGKAIAELERH